MIKKNIERGARLRKLRFDKKLTQTELAKEVGLTSQQISQIEGGRAFGINTATKLAEFYKVDVHWLMEDVFDLAEYKKYKNEKQVVSDLQPVDLEERFDLFQENIQTYIINLLEEVENLYDIVERQDVLLKQIISHTKLPVEYPSLINRKKNVQSGLQNNLIQNYI